MIKENEVMRFSRFSVIQATAATFKQIAIDTNLSIRTPFVWMVKSLQLEIKATEIEWPAQNVTENVEVQFTRDSKAAMIAYDDADLLEKYTHELSRVATIGTDAGPAYREDINPRTFVYTTPIIYAGAALYVGINSTNSSVITVKGRIGYTIEKVSETAFFRFASAL